ncbi:MAG: mercury resistance system periplasmic binding protein MerP [Alphaproteobacteria bacterium]|nr:mercury resistance system periplasmic binding protein MerP [Alphaproteobacteria bacterium]MBM4073429.1 mercury resistance system periplasmic binding protein MerP [Planctomycetota bacterium]
MRLALLVVAALAVVAPRGAFAAERSVTLAVKNMDCAACPYTVRASLQKVAGVKQVTVSYKDKTAVITYDDARTDVEALVAATTNAGYPSAPKS